MGLLFFKQTTAYDLRMSDWSSDVCSSDLLAGQAGHRRFVIVEVLDIAADQHIAPLDLRPQRLREVGDEEVDRQLGEDGIIGAFGQAEENGRASGRDSGGEHV